MIAEHEATIIAQELVRLAGLSGGFRPVIRHFSGALSFSNLDILMSGVRVTVDDDGITIWQNVRLATFPWEDPNQLAAAAKLLHSTLFSTASDSEA